MLKEWGNLTKISMKTVGGLGPWVWRAQDRGTFDIISTDWDHTHFQKIKNINRRRTAIQAGGNMGMYPRLLSEYFELVYTFEPEPLNFFCLANNCQRYNIVKFQGFLSDGAGFHGFKLPSSDGNAGEFGMVANKGYIPSFMIDSFGFKDVDLIWLDIEGSEPFALRGALKTIKKYHPVLMIENGDTTALVKEILAPLGYVKIDKSHRDGVFIHKKEIS